LILQPGLFLNIEILFKNKSGVFFAKV